MRRSFVTVLMVVFAVLAGGAVLQAQPNPFFGDPSQPQSPQEQPSEGRPGDAGRFGAPAAEGASGATLSGAPAWLLRLQRELNTRLTAFIREMGATTGNPRAWVAVIGASFLYGLMHSFLPGHRKTVIVSYYLSEDAEVLHGVLAGVLFALMHALSAVAIIAGVYFLVDGALSQTVVLMGSRVQAVSSGLIMLVGLAFVLVKLTQLRDARRNAVAARVGRELNLGAAVEGADAELPGAQAERLRIPRERFFPLVLSTGIVPCPGTTLLLLFTLSLGLIRVGIVAIVSMSVGIAIALSAVAVLTIVFKRNIARRLDRRGGHMLHTAIELAGASFIFLFGFVTMFAFL